MCFRCGHAMSEAVKNHHCADIREEVGTYEYCSNCYAGILVARLVWMEVVQTMQQNPRRFKTLQAHKDSAILKGHYASKDIHMIIWGIL